jgi:acyl-CoA reductase-like NAD-dependent aldehyde dehydrogenase
MTLSVTPDIFRSRNPATGQDVQAYPLHDPAEVEQCLASVDAAWRELRATTVGERAAMLIRLAGHLDAHGERYSRLITTEMGKPIGQSRAEIAKCATTCRTLADRGAEWLAPLPVETEARSAYVRFDGLGPILAVMPWNFPFFQVIRFFAGALLAGNTALVKHAENVPGCAGALEEAVAASGAPDGTLRNIRVPREAVGALIDDPRVRSVTFTGSVAAGRAVAGRAASIGKKSVLELGGSDPFVVFGDADLAAAVPAAIQARFANSGQSCICGKRFVVDQRIAADFAEAFADAARRLVVGDPADDRTAVGPLAREDLRATVQAQTERTVALGARVLLPGGPQDGPGYFFAPMILADVPDGAPAAREEIFGPVASIFTFSTEAEAADIANATGFGLGSSVWTQDDDRAARFIDALEAGAVFVNEVVRSDVRLPFGGVKDSGYGRELGLLGTREFTNPKTVWVA